MNRKKIPSPALIAGTIILSVFSVLSGISARIPMSSALPSQTQYDNDIPDLEYALPVNAFSKLSSSSTLKAQGANNYSVKNLFDRDLSTCWSEGVKGVGEGEWIEFELKDDTGIYEIWIGAGYLKSPDTYKKNSIPLRIEISLFYDHSDKPDVIYADLKSIDNFYNDMYNGVQLLNMFDETIHPYKIRLTILKVLPGTKYQDTCISELYFFGTFNGE
jgi:hypothetical protein